MGKLEKLAVADDIDITCKSQSKRKGVSLK